MITDYIKKLININKTSVETISVLEGVITEFKIENDKDKADFGNLCLILKANRTIADAIEAMLINENVLKDNDGAYYKKIEDNETPVNEPETKEE